MCLTKENMLYWSINHLVMMLKRYYTYEFKDKKHIIIKTFNAKAYYQSHEPDYKERICINRFGKGETMKN